MTEEKELVRWFAEVFISEIILQEGSSRCWVTFDPVFSFKMTDESCCWTVFRREKVELNASGILLEVKNDGDDVAARLFRSNSRFAINGFVDKDELIRLKLAHAKLRVGIKDGTNDILQMDVV